eukprot:364859-Chlamydomonas_euryale.AAC.2
MAYFCVGAQLHGCRHQCARAGRGWPVLARHAAWSWGEVQGEVPGAGRSFVAPGSAAVCALTPGVPRCGTRTQLHASILRGYGILLWGVDHTHGRRPSVQSPKKS